MKKNKLTPDSSRDLSHTIKTAVTRFRSAAPKITDKYERDSFNGFTDALVMAYNHIQRGKSLKPDLQSDIRHAIKVGNKMVAELHAQRPCGVKHYLLTINKEQTV